MSAAPPADGAVLVIDSSVAFKWFVADREEAVDEARSLLERHAAGEIVLAAPGHLTLEVLNALKHRGVDAETLARAGRSLEAARLELAPVADLATEASAIALRCDLTLYDAAFAALAIRLDTELVTADRRLAASGACRIRPLGA
jgi:predicted nucleic acid-binding protein